MTKVKLTVSLPDDVASYLRSRPNASAVVAEAVQDYRARKLEETLAAAYREGAEEAERLNQEWESADAEVGD